MAKLVDFSAPILPGKQAAGVGLYDRIDDVAGLQVLDCDMSPYTTSAKYESFFVCGSVTIASLLGLVIAVTVTNGYQGLIESAIGIGSTLKDVEDKLEGWAEDENDNIILRNRPGVIVEVTTPRRRSDVRKAPICSLCVFDPKPDSLSTLLDSELSVYICMQRSLIDEKEATDALRKIQGAKEARGWSDIRLPTL